MNIIQLLKDQKRELEESLGTSVLITREATHYFSNLTGSSLIKVISGVRRSGKSVFIYMLLKGKNFAYVNFDDDRLIGVESDKIMSTFYEIYGKDFKYIFIDEVQNLPNWELFVNRLHRAGFNLFLTGSNAKLLSKELATHLTGRHIKIELYPFSFKEFLSTLNFNEDIETSKGKGLLKQKLQDYLDLSGFPEIVMKNENPNIYLRELYQSIISRDIINRYDIAYKKTFREIAQTLISNPSRSISYNKLKRQFQLKSEHTIKNYVSYLEEAYLITLISRFSLKPVEVEKSEKKVYVIDSGLINYITLKFSKDFGRLYENIVAIELLRRKSFNTQIEIYYWKSIQHEEVDFVVKEGLKVKQLIQVCYNIDDYDTKEREIRSLLKAEKEIKCNNLIIITYDHESEELIEGKKIKYVPLLKWLLD